MRTGILPEEGRFPVRHARLSIQLFTSYVSLVVVALAAVAAYVSHTVHHFYLEEAAAQLAASARTIGRRIAQPLAQGDYGTVDEWCKIMAAVRASRVTVLTASGRVVGDSEGDAETMENHLGRPEVAEALATGHGRHIRFSHTVQKEMLYVAVPVVSGEDPAGVVRLAVPLTFLQTALRQLHTRFAVAGVAAVLLTSLFALVLARRITKPLKNMTALADDFAGGRLEQRTTPAGAAESVRLARALNVMADQFEERIALMQRQHNELEAVLSSMVEGVLAVDSLGRVLSLNKAAAGLLRVTPVTAPGRNLRELVRNPELHAFIDRVLAVGQPLEGEVVLYEEVERYVQVHGTRLASSEGHPAGAVIVMEDVTHLRRLERVRRDFVANVSHELRTPVTSIKGYVETLLEGAIEEPASARRFLEIVGRQADRLIEIIQDLLTLARIEQEARGAIARQCLALRPILEAAVTTCAAKAAARGMHVHLHCDPVLEAHVNAALLEQAVVNLLDNAITYSDSGDTIELEAASLNGSAIIRVTDHGPGIERRHLPRLFERFYRIDKARSRKAGGTGLGLAIVKHIVQAHEGHVEVRSVPGQGSTFTLHLPEEESR